jgi:hypothetical protein
MKSMPPTCFLVSNNSEMAMADIEGSIEGPGDEDYDAAGRCQRVLT